MPVVQVLGEKHRTWGEERANKNNIRWKRGKERWGIHNRCPQEVSWWPGCQRKPALV